MVLLHFRVHGTGVYRARLGRFGFVRSRCVAPGHVLLWGLDEFRAALGTAKVEVMPFVFHRMMGLISHTHAADGILEIRRWMGRMRVMALMGVAVVRRCS